MDPRDALPHARRAVHSGGGSVLYTGQGRRSKVDRRMYSRLSSIDKLTTRRDDRRAVAKYSKAKYPNFWSILLKHSIG